MTEQISPEVLTAALWLSLHRDECPNPIIPFVRKRFSLTALEAITALKQGRMLARSVNKGDQCHER